MASQYVGIDLHRRRSVIVPVPDDEALKTVRINHDPVALACQIEKAGPDLEVVLEATYGWYVRHEALMSVRDGAW